jgi:hypothetical protein
MAVVPYHPVVCKATNCGTILNPYCRVGQCPQLAAVAALSLRLPVDRMLTRSLSCALC